MRFTLRLAAALSLSALAVIGAFTVLQIRAERHRLTIDLERRAFLLAEGLKEAVEPVMERPAAARLERIVAKFQRPRQAIAIYDRVATPLISARPGTGASTGPVPEVTEAMATGTSVGRLTQVDGLRTYVYATPLTREDKGVGALAVFLDASNLDAAEWALWRANALRFGVLAVVMSVNAFLVVRWTITDPMKRMAEWTRALRTGQLTPPPPLPDDSLFAPLAQQVTGMAKSLSRARLAAEEEAALRVKGDTVWTEERLKQFVNLRLGGPLFVVSNREPVSHVRRSGRVEVVMPASGLVTAMEPVLRACGGVWVAHGSGDADRDVVDAYDRVGVPIDDPRYALRRVWLTAEEEEGYYFGFANEGLWPLCHIVHTRPLFRPSDFAYYRQVNQRFADALLEEMEKTDAPLVLIQDYHFALLAGLVKQRRPDARIAIFWHIPWPNFEAFSICPWQEELLLGMLGADLVGFHTQYHCNNFLETVERTIEARVDWERFSVVRGQHTAHVKPFPISVAPQMVEDPPDVSREQLLAELGVSAEFLGVGVERVDYTKGLPERFRALERFFERNPAYLGRVVFAQLAAPSRSRIQRYQDLQLEVEEIIKDINGRLQSRSWRPILYLSRHHDHREIWPFYRHADFCMVTSLHDGMNLVAKEYVSAREDDGGVLILSQFTGAARELLDALLVNPYDVDETADAIRAAIEMSPADRAARMARLRMTVREHNVFRWAGQLLGELSRIPEEAPARADLLGPPPGGGSGAA